MRSQSRFFLVLVLSFHGAALAVLPTYVEIRELKVSEPTILVCEGVEKGVRGISNAGDAFGNACTEDTPGNNQEVGFRWLRSADYTEENIGRGGICFSTFGGATPCNRAQRFSVDNGLQETLDNGVVTEELQLAVRGAVCDPKAPECVSPYLIPDKATIAVVDPGVRWTITYPDGHSILDLRQEKGAINVFTPDRGGAVGIGGGSGLTSQGFAGGRWNRGNPEGGWGIFRYDINTNEFTNIVPGVALEGNGANNLGQVVAIPTRGGGNVIADETGILHQFPQADFRLNDIDDNGNAIGNSGTRAAISVQVAAAGEAGALGGSAWSDPMVLDHLPGVPPFASQTATSISDTNGRIAGTSFDFAAFSAQIVIWDAETQDLIANLGGPFGGGAIQINGAGNMLIAHLGLAERLPTLFVTDDDWATFEQLNINDLLADLPTGIDWFELERVDDINDSGQMVGRGTLNNTFERALFLLDTMELGVGVIKGDVNNDGVVDFIDITPFINAQSAEGDEAAFLLLTPNGCFLCADIDMDGAIDFLDITPFVVLLDQIGAAAVPEPATLLLALPALLMLMRRRRREERRA